MGTIFGIGSLDNSKKLEEFTNKYKKSNAEYEQRPYLGERKLAIAQGKLMRFLIKDMGYSVDKMAQYIAKNTK